MKEKTMQSLECMVAVSITSFKGNRLPAIDNV